MVAVATRGVEAMSVSDRALCILCFVALKGVLQRVDPSSSVLYQLSIRRIKSLKWREPDGLDYGGWSTEKIGLWSNDPINYVRYITDSFQLLSVKIFRAIMF